MAATRRSVIRETVDCHYECTLAAHAAFEAGLDAIGELRETPGLEVAPQLPPRFLRHADEQAVVGMATVLRAMAAYPDSSADFSHWGVLAAPCMPGRLNGAYILSKFQQQGAAAVSPHVIPQHSLHSVSSAISVGLGMRGPNFGIGGGPEALAEGLTVAMSFLHGAAVPGLWLVLTQWEPEAIPDGNGGSCVPALCRAVALGLLPAAAGYAVRGATLRLSFGPPSHTLAVHRGDGPGEDVHRPSALSQLADVLVAVTGGRSSARWLHPLPWGGWLELTLAAQRQRKAA